MNRPPKTWFCTHFSPSAKETEGRIRNLFQGAKKRPPVTALLAIALAAALCGNLVACGDRGDGGSAELPMGTETLIPTPTPAAATAGPENAGSPPGGQGEGREADAARRAFGRVLRAMLEANTLPDGTVVTETELQGDMERNLFLLQDVDRDGEEELVVWFSTTYTAGHRGYILGYDRDRGETYMELEGYPAFWFYENGAVRVGLSHNHTYGEMWPYILYSYDSGSDSYFPVAQVRAADRELLERLDKGDEYPAQADVSGEGTVYYVDDVPWDGADYRDWLQDWLGCGAEEDEKVDFLWLTEENIAALCGAGEGM